MAAAEIISSETWHRREHTLTGS